MIITKITPVAWSEGRVLKYRAMIGLSLGRQREPIKTIYGDPEPTEEKAWESLIEECQLVLKTAEEGLKEIYRRRNKNGN